MAQREKMLELFEEHGDNRAVLVREYAAAERRGDVPRASNTHNWTPEQYAGALLNDGKRKGWLKRK